MDKQSEDDKLELLLVRYVACKVHENFVTSKFEHSSRIATMRSLRRRIDALHKNAKDHSILNPVSENEALSQDLKRQYMLAKLGLLPTGNPKADWAMIGMVITDTSEFPHLPHFRKTTAEIRQELKALKPRHWTDLNARRAMVIDQMKMLLDEAKQDGFLKGREYSDLTVLRLIQNASNEDLTGDQDAVELLVKSLKLPKNVFEITTLSSSISNGRAMLNAERDRTLGEYP